MKKFKPMLFTAVMAIGCAFAFTACGGTSENTGTNSAKNSENSSSEEKLEYSVYGNFTYEKNGSDKDSKGATYRCWVDTGNKFHIYGTLTHDDNTTSTLEFEGQVTYISAYELTCVQVMFFTYTYHGQSSDEYLAGAKSVVSAYKTARAEDYGTNDFKMTLVRTTNDTSETGNAGTFYVEEGWDLSEGVWDYNPTTVVAINK